MSVEENKALVRHMIEDVVNERHLDLIGEVFSTSFRAGGKVLGLEPIGPAVEHHHAEFSGFRLSIKEMVAEGDRVVFHGAVSGTHSGEVAVGGISVSATGKSAEWSVFGLYTVEGGRIVEEIALGDDLGLLKQLGVVPAPGPSASAGV